LSARLLASLEIRGAKPRVKPLRVDPLPFCFPVSYGSAFMDYGKRGSRQATSMRRFARNLGAPSRFEMRKSSPRCVLARASSIHHDTDVWRATRNSLRRAGSYGGVENADRLCRPAEKSRKRAMRHTRALGACIGLRCACIEHPCC